MDEDEIDFLEDPPAEDEQAPSLPQGALVLPGYDVTGSPDGTGSVTERRGGASRKRAPAVITPEVRQRQLEQESRAAGDPVRDVIQAFTGIDVRGGHMGREESLGARERTRDVASRLARRASGDPMGTLGATAYGLVSGGTSSALDEILGAIYEPAQVLPRAISSLGIGPDPDDMTAEEALRQVRTRRDELRGRAPEAMALAEAGGEAAQMAIPPMRAESAMGRILVGAGEGALYGGLHGLGAADPETAEEALLYGGGGALMGGGLGGSLTGLSEVGRSRLARMADTGRARRELDDATLAAMGQSGGGISVRSQRFARGQSPAAQEASRAAAAAELRAADVIPAAGTTGDTLARVQAARQAGFDTLEQIASDMGERGATAGTVADQLRLAARETRGALAGDVRTMYAEIADQLEEYYGRDGVIDYRSLMAELEALRHSGAYQTRAGRQVPLRGEVASRTYDRLRGAYDDSVEAALGPERREAFQAARRRETALRTAEELALEGTAREAERGPLGAPGILALTGAGTAGSGLLGSGHTGAGLTTMAGGVALAAGAEQYRRRSPRLRYTRASAMDRVARILSSPRARELGRYAESLREAATRGSESLAATTWVLMERDPEFRATVESIDFDEDPIDPYADTPGMRAIAGEETAP